MSAPLSSEIYRAEVFEGGGDWRYGWRASFVDEDRQYYGFQTEDEAQASLDEYVVERGAT